MQKGVQPTSKQRFQLYAFYYLLGFLFTDWSNLLDLLEMQTVIKQAICVSVLHMCCKYGNKQHVTKPPQKYVFLPKQPKENTEKITNLIIFYFAWLYDAEIPKLCHYVVSSIVFTNIPRSRNY